MLARQTSFFGGGPPAFDATFSGALRTRLDETAWVERVPSWLSGHERLLDELFASTKWQAMRREMYERTVDVPRLVASLPEDGPGHPLLDEARRTLSAHYRTNLCHTTLALYRDGNDSVAWHGDYVARDSPEDTLVASLSLGEPRRLLLRPRGTARNGKVRRALAFPLGWGDLFVMGGACQRTWEHAVPKVSHAHPRLVVMFRPNWYRPMVSRGGESRAPSHRWGSRMTSQRQRQRQRKRQRRRHPRTLPKGPREKDGSVPPARPHRWYPI